MVQIGNFLFKYRNAILPALFLGIFIPSPRVFHNPVTALVLGLAISLLGQLVRMATIGLVYIIRGGREGKVYAQDLVTTGIFAHCRNPLYVGNILVGVGMGLASNNLIFFLLISAAIVFVYVAIVAAEEAFLSVKFGKQYQAYMESVNRWVPSLKSMKGTFADHAFAWKRVVLKEYNSTFTGITLGFLLIIKGVHDNPHVFPNSRESYSVLLGVWLTLVVFYAWVKFLKKTKRLTESGA